MAKRPAKKNAKVKAKRTAKKAAPKRAAKRAVAKAPAKRTVMVRIPQHLSVDLPPVLHDRLKGLSTIMGLSMEGVVRQALTEFADTWEEHHRTVSALAEGSDRMQLAVKE